MNLLNLCDKVIRALKGVHCNSFCRLAAIHNMATALIRNKFWLRALLLWLFAAIMPSVDSCPEVCQCHRSGALVKVVCSGRQLREIPDGIPQNTFSL